MCPGFEAFGNSNHDVIQPDIFIFSEMTIEKLSSPSHLHPRQKPISTMFVFVEFRVNRFM